MKNASYLLIALGVLGVIVALSMDVALPGSRIVNMHLLSERQNYLIISVGMFVSGIFLLVSTKNAAPENDSEARKNIEIVNEESNPVKICNTATTAKTSFRHERSIRAKWLLAGLPVVLLLVIIELTKEGDRQPASQDKAIETAAVNIPPQEHRPASCYRGVKALEEVTLSGTLTTVPMIGARIVLNSVSRGTVLLDAPLDFSTADKFEKQQVTIVVSGTIQNWCSSKERQRQTENDYKCMWQFDSSRPITVTPIAKTEIPPDKIFAIPVPQEPPNSAPMDARYSATEREVVDKQTNLIWRRCAEGQRWNGHTCSGEAKSFEHDSAEKHAAQQSSMNGVGWRVPTKTELLSLVVGTRKCPAIDVVAFGSDAGGSFLHEKPADYLCCQSRAVVNFSDGTAGLDFSEGARLRLVRNH